MKTDRRNFLIQTASAAGVIGLGYLLGEKPAAEGFPGDVGRPPIRKPAGELLKAAVARMAAEGKPGIAIRIPSTPDQRHNPGHLLIYALNDESPDPIDLFAQSIVVCLESDALQDQIDHADPSHTVVLFDSQRRAVAGLSLDFATAWETFPRDLLGLLHGTGDQRLKARAETVEKKADPPVLAALRRLLLEEDRKLVAEHAGELVPLLILERRGEKADSTRGVALASILKSYVLSANPKTPGVRLPFGVEAAQGGGGCGDSCSERPAPPDGRRVMVACGMGRAGPNIRSFVRYLRT